MKSENYCRATNTARKVGETGDLRVDGRDLFHDDLDNPLWFEELTSDKVGVYRVISKVHPTSPRKSLPTDRKILSTFLATKDGPRSS
jgi:hypothetical protein